MQTAKTKPRAFVFIRGGCLESIRSNVSNLEVILIDQDNDDPETGKLNRKFAKQTKKLKQVW